MTILEYDLEKAKLEAEIKILKKYLKKYEGTMGEGQLIDELEHNEYLLNQLINSQIPF